ncbi:hypothetical protein [Levilactobacillus andaensis]|uniref:hypothetical protein n=1 Tax=Levilactobacillus andaensis TaxID=2799570 RepID=UPI001942A805|nr:hypothetical protein [Levilactobacillus andaensis]
MMPEGLEDFDFDDVHVFINGKDLGKIGRLPRMPIYLGGNRAWRRSKERNPRDHAKFYRKDQIRPWIS